MPLVHRYIFASLTLLASQGAFDEKEEPFKVVGQFTGSNSLIETPNVMMVKGQPGWNDVWQQHRQTAVFTPQGAPRLVDDVERPTVNFRKNVVLCLFGGQSRNVGGFEVSGVGEVKGTIVLRVRPILLPGNGAGVLQNPFLMVMLPRTKKKMQVQLDQSPLGVEGFRVLGNFEATADKK